MSGFVFAIPGALDLPTGGYAYDRRVIDECRRAGGAVTHLALPGGFPFPTPDELQTSARMLAALPAGQPVLIDGLALGALPADLLRGLRHPIAALVHHPLALEAGLGEGQRAALHTSERAALAQASAVIATSPATARRLQQDYGVAPDRMAIARPGTDPAPRARGTSSRGTGQPVRLLSVGAVIPRKAHGVLVDALARLAARDWTCHIVGATDRDAEETRAVQARIAAQGLGGRIELTGSIPPDALARHFDAADIFISASLFEGYGMGLSEALACGLPIVASRAGAIPDTVPAAAGLLVTPGDSEGLAGALGALLDAPERRRQMAESAWHHAQTLPRWPQTAAIILETLQTLSRQTLSRQENSR
ncbi:glycosyltransferase involved in cell wall biosynthesis [Angulomicrobium tetraedrale]|uniref:Glycosyltransferase involved in cell wall biosynthesis n=1 Tax=Ancylobacter tetraedralis TaxID=217068 RepID=A0A839Z8F0_9HYPH|nr:glycosyltransferase family 4 protein [Ancylobacter tetraedralis]MBB3770475.1 glycosyltransferase involved in cell wall biosynthesis [Ancylobacter tetraedralis]